jgi:hypothetical protein
MPLGFLVPAFLVAGLAVALPVWLHLRQRERKVPIAFPSLMFLARIPHRTADRRRLTNVLLLALRALAVILIAIAFARPFLQDDTAAAATRRARDVVIVVDRSMSMGYTGSWAALRDSVRGILAGLGSGDRAALVLVDEGADVAAPLTGEHASVTAALAAATPLPSGARLGAGIRTAARLLVDSSSIRGEILLLSDFQRSGAAGLEGVALPPGATVRPVIIAPGDRPNAAILGVETVRRGGEGDGGAEVTARAVWYGGTAPRQVRAALELGGREVASATATLAPNAVTPIRFVAPRVPPGTVRGVVRLAPDALPADDEFRFALASDALIRVKIIAPADLRAAELLFLQHALTIGRPPRFTVEVSRAGPLALNGLGRGSAVVFLDRLPTDDAGRRAFSGFLDRGGGAIALTGSRLPTRNTPPAPDDPWPASVGAVVTRTESPGVLGGLDRDHPALAPLQGIEGSGFSGARFFRYRALLPRDDSDVLVRLDDGKPALVASRDQSRRVLMLAAPADGVWSDLALHPFFLPLLQRLVEHVAGGGTERSAREVGDVLALEAPVSRSTPILSPDGQTIRIDTSGTLALRMPGFYEARREGSSESAALIAVNPPAAESDLTRMDPREVVLAVRADSSAVGASSEALLTPVDVERRQRFWRAILLAALVLLAVEVIYANLGPGRRAPGAVAT